MSTPPPPPRPNRVTNLADGNANIGFQAGTVHNATVYQVAEDAAPDEKFRKGVNYLGGGMPEKARELIGDAIAQGFDTNEVWFHWLLAMLSDRTLRQFSDEDFAQLNTARMHIPLHRTDEWTDGLRVISSLLNSLDKPQTDISSIVEEFDDLDKDQHDKILRHLELFLKGPLEDELWARTLQRVKADQLDHGRKDRVWKFFQPDPRQARFRRPVPVRMAALDWIRTVSMSAVFVVAVGYLGWLLLGRGQVLPLLAYYVGLACAGVCSVCGLDWHRRQARLREKEQIFRSPRLRIGPPEGGFADDVDKLFAKYFARYRPDLADRTRWANDTAGIHRYLRDEMVEVYRDTATSAPEIAWLIRHLVRDVASRWTKGTLFEHRKKLRTPGATRAACVLAVLLLLPCAAWSAGNALVAAPLMGLLAVFSAVVAGVIAAKRWSLLVVRRYNYTADLEEYQQRKAAASVELRRWMRRLRDKPHDAEMADWLDCDRRVLMDQAMTVYKLAPSKVIAHAFIAAPAARTKKARYPFGPWRYSRYKLLVFLLTADGVRQAVVDLNFERGSFHDWRRLNYRFDAVATVEVSEKDNHERTFELCLLNNQQVELRVTEASTGQVGGIWQEDPEALSDIALDATGLSNTLYVLEGVAAEGKEWIEHERRRGANRIAEFTSAIDEMLS
jgi:hypothetical protein